MENQILQKKPLFNPLDHEFSYEILDNNNQPVMYIMPSLEISYFEEHIYPIMKKHLIDVISNERELGLYDMEKLKQIESEVVVTL